MEKKHAIVIGLAGLVLVGSLFSKTPQVDEAQLLNQNKATFNQLFDLANQMTEDIIQDGDTQNRVLVIPIEGVIGQESATYQHDHLLASIDKIKEDKTIKAVLLSIDSPGGGVYATRELYDRMKAVQAETDLPVYASMGSTAASGGYYLAMLGDKVYGSQETITGSIGVIMSGYNTAGLLDKLGVKPVVYKSGAMKDIMSGSRDATEEERQVLQTYIDESYQRFVDVVVEGRGLSEEAVRKLADGRIYSGQQAKNLGLIDQLGYESDALADLMAEHGLEGAQVFSYQPSDLGFGKYFPSILGKLGLDQASTPAGQLNQAIEKIQSLDNMSLEYRMEGGR